MLLIFTIPNQYVSIEQFCKFLLFYNLYLTFDSPKVTISPFVSKYKNVID